MATGGAAVTLDETEAAGELRKVLIKAFDAPCDVNGTSVPPGETAAVGTFLGAYDPSFPWEQAVLEPTVSSWRAVAFGLTPSGTPAVVYSVTVAGKRTVRYGWMEGDAWRFSDIESNLTSVAGVDMAASPSGLACVAYSTGSYPNYVVKCAWYDGVAWQVSTVGEANSDAAPNIVVLSSGRPAVTYRGRTSSELRFSSFDGGAWQTTIVDSDLRGGNDLAILQTGNPAVSFIGGSNYVLKYAYLRDGVWHKSIIGSASDVSGGGLKVLPTGHPAIIYRSGSTLKYAEFDGITWATHSVSTVSTYDAGSLAIDPTTGLPAASFIGTLGAQAGGSCVRYASFNGSTWRAVPVHSVMSTATSRLMFSPSGRPAICSIDDSSDNLVHAVPPVVEPAPVSIGAAFVASLTTVRGGTVSQANAAVEVATVVPGTWLNGFERGLAQLESSFAGHLIGQFYLTTSPGSDCLAFDPQFPICYREEPVAAGVVRGEITGDITIGTSDSQPAGAPLDMSFRITVNGTVGAVPDHRVLLKRGDTVVADVSSGTQDVVTVPVWAGETLHLALSAADAPSGYTSFSELVRFLGTLVTPRFAPVDFDRDRDVDSDDFEYFKDCATGPGIEYGPGSLPLECAIQPDAFGLLAADLDRDRDVDQDDFGTFQRCFSGENYHADTKCAH